MGHPRDANHGVPFGASHPNVGQRLGRGSDRQLPVTLVRNTLGVVQESEIKVGGRGVCPARLPMHGSGHQKSDGQQEAPRSGRNASPAAT